MSSKKTNSLEDERIPTINEDNNDMMGDMVERRFRASIIMTGSAWYTAWVLAGQPDLELLGKPVLSDEELQKQLELDKKYQEGKIKGREHQD